MLCSCSLGSTSWESGRSWTCDGLWCCGRSAWPFSGEMWPHSFYILWYKFCVWRETACFRPCMADMMFCFVPLHLFTREGAKSPNMQFYCHSWSVLSCHVFPLQYLRSFEDRILHGEHHLHRRLQEVSVRQQLLQCPRQQVLGVCFCPEQGPRAGWGPVLVSPKY